MSRALSLLLSTAFLIPSLAADDRVHAPPDRAFSAFSEDESIRYLGKESWQALEALDGSSLEWSVEGERLAYRRGERSLSLTRHP